MLRSSATYLIAGCLFPCLPLSGQDGEIPQAVPVDIEPADSLEPALADVVVSRSQQFRVRGGSSALRGSVALLAEQTRDEFLHLIGGDNNVRFNVPVHITLFGNPGDPAPPRTIATNITIGEDGYELRLSLHLGRGLEVALFQDAVTAALIYERTLATHQADDADTPLLVSPWLVEGLREANRWRLGGGDRRLYEVLFRSGGLFELDDLFDMSEAAHDRLDAATRAAFQVSSGALVMALLEQPDGREAFRDFLGQVARFGGEMPNLLRRHFPELNLSENSMAKWWALQMANKGAAKLTESLTIAETEAALDDALRLRFRDEDGGMRETSIDNWLEMAGLDEVDRTAAVRMAEDALVRLSYRCFPTYRPLLLAYQGVLTRMARDTGEPEAIAIELDELAATRRIIVSKAERAHDYMDWFEITRARETSGVFDDYLRLKAQLQDRPQNSRTDPVSNVLDQFDTIFHRPSSATPRPWSGDEDSGWSAPNLPSRP